MFKVLVSLRLVSFFGFLVPPEEVKSFIRAKDCSLNTEIRDEFECPHLLHQMAALLKRNRGGLERENE